VYATLDSYPKVVNFWPCYEADDHVQEATIDLLIDAVLQALGGRSIIALLCKDSVRSEVPEKRRCNIALQWWQKVFAKIWHCCQRNKRRLS
jgi:hypothetical protein